MTDRVRLVRRVGVGQAMAAAGMALLVGVGFAQAQDQLGDCNRDGRLTADEMVIGADIALGGLAVTSCPQFNGNDDGQVTVDELVKAVSVALAGSTPTPTMTPASTETATATATSTPTTTPTDVPTVSQQFAFVVATDFQTGSFATIGLDEPRAVTPVNQNHLINPDAVARTHDGLVYVINRFGADNIQVLDPAHNFTTLLQCSTGAGSDPTDIAFVSPTKAYVALSAAADLLIVNPSAQADCSDFVLGHVDLSAYADADGIPDMNQLAVVGDRVYVSLERLTNFSPTEPGLLVVIDTTTDTIVNQITLSGENPFGQSKGLSVIDGAIVVAEVGKFGTNDGGIERVDLTSETAGGFFVTEADLGGDINDFVLVSDHLGYALISQPDFTTTNLVAFDPVARTVTQTLISGGILSDIELDDRGELFVADRDRTNPGIRIYRASDGTQLTPAALDLGLPPFDIVFVP